MRRRLAALAGLACLAGGACRRGTEAADSGPEPPIRVTVVLHPQLRIDASLDELQQRVARAAARWLRATPEPRVAVDPERPLVLALRVDLSEDLGRLVVREEVRARHERTWPLAVDRRREVPIGPAGVDLGATLAGGVEAALGLLAEMESLFRADDNRLRETAAREDAPDDLRCLAVRILQERKARAAMPDLLDLFPSAPSDLRLTILDATPVLAGPAELGRLLRQIDGRRVDEVSRALRAAAILGGRDACEFAGWLALGHPDERVRQTALEAYQQIVETMPPGDGDELQIGLADIR